MHVTPRSSGLQVFFVALLLALFASPLAAQQTTGRVEGRVIDAQSGQPLAGAQVSIVGTRYGNLTNEDGYYFVNNVPAGLHDIQVQYIGYQTVTVAGQRILVGQTARVDFRVSPQAVAIEAITVQGERNPVVPRDQTQSKAIVTSDVAKTLPVENVRAVVALQPGVVETGSSLGQVIRGGRPGEAAVYVDGVLVRNFNSGSQGEVELQTNAVEEIDVLLGGYGAEYGQAQSGVINLVSRGGGTQYSGAFTLETDELSIGNSYGYNRLEASISGPILGERLGFSLSGAVVGEKDANPTFNDLGTFTFAGADGESFSLSQERFFRPTGATLVENASGDTTGIVNFEEIDGLGDRKPWNNGDSYNLNLTFRGLATSTTRFNLGYTTTRDQRRFFSPYWQFRPIGMPGRREESWLLRGGIEQILFQGAESSAALRVNVGYGNDYFMQGPLGETFADTTKILNGDLYPMEGDLLGFTFKDFTSPFEDKFTVERWMARRDSVTQDPSLAMLLAAETLINPATGKPYTVQEANSFFNTRLSPTGDPFGLGSFGTAGFTGYGYRNERTLSLRADLDWQANRQHRIGIGGEVYKKDIENLTGGAGAFGVPALVSAFQNVYDASPIIGGFYVKDRVDLGEMVIEAGLRLDMFDSDVVYPTLPGFSLPVLVGDEMVEPTFVQQKTQWQLSPRLGVGFPVTENTQFRLSYGHFTQVPPLVALFANVNADASKSNQNTTYGRPVGFGRTIGYEAGFTHAFNPSTVLDLSAYSREKQGDIAFRAGPIDFPGKGPTETRFLTTADFGHVRGVDARLSRRFGNILNVQAGYSYLDTRSTGSDPTQYLNGLARRTDPVTGEPYPAPQAAFATNFDQTHTLSLSGVVNTPADFSEGTANLLLRNTTASIAFQARSGVPYTPVSNEGVLASGGGAADPIFDLSDFQAARMDWTFVSNMRVGRGFTVAGNQIGAYVDVRNLLNIKNVNDMFANTGSPTNPGPRYVDNQITPFVGDADITIADVENDVTRAIYERRETLFGNGDGVLSVDEQRQVAAANYIASGYSYQIGQYTGNFYGQPRQIRLGLEWNF